MQGKVDVARMSIHGSNGIAVNIGKLQHDKFIEAGRLAQETTLEPSKETFFTIGRKWTGEKAKATVVPESQVTVNDADAPVLTATIPTSGDPSADVNLE